MKRARLVLGGIAALAAGLLAGCKEDPNVALPSLTVGPTTLTFTQEGGASNSQTLNLISNRDWTASCDADWVVFTPSEGVSSTETIEITVYVNPNTDTDRTATILFASSTVSQAVTVNQSGPSGTVEDTYVYYNDFDAEAATQAYGSSGSSWPYLDQFDGWQNAIGSGAENVTYTYSGVSARNNSNSDGSYSDYEGSGTNNLLFGTDAYFRVSGITLPEGSNFTLSFGTEKYAYGVDDNTFVPSEFHVYISNDDEKWVELQYEFPEGYKNGRWDLASTTFTLPSGTQTISIHISSDLSSAHRLDDLLLAPASASGTSIDFSQGVELGGGNAGVGDTGAFADVINAETGAAVSAEGTVVGIYNCGMVINEGEDNLLVYNGSSNFTPPSLNIGDRVSVSGTRAAYGDLPQLAATYENITVISTGNAVTYPEPVVVTGDNIASFDKTKCVYMQYEGVLSISGNYYNVAIDGTSVQGSLSYPLASLELSNYTGITATYTGYFCGGTNSNYLNMLVVSVESDQVQPDPDPEPEPEPDPEIEALTIADFLAREEGDTYYRLTGVISDLNNTTYGNFNLTDDTGTVYVYGLTATKVTSNDRSFSTLNLKEGDILTLEGKRASYNGSPQVGGPAYYISHIEGTVDPEEPEDPDDGGGSTGSAFDSSISWTLGANAYDNTSGTNSQTGTINGVEVGNLLKLGTSSKQGEATLHIPAGTTKLGFYAVAWKNKNGVTITFGEDTVVSVSANEGATGNPPYTITCTDSDYYTIDVDAAAGLDLTLTASDRVILWGINPVE